MSETPMPDGIFDVFDMNSRVGELEKWRGSLNGDVKHVREDVADIRQVLDQQVVPTLDDLVEKTKIKEAVAEALKKQRAHTFTTFEKLLAVIVSITAIGGFILSALAYIHGG